MWFSVSLRIPFAVWQLWQGRAMKKNRKKTKEIKSGGIFIFHRWSNWSFSISEHMHGLWIVGYTTWQMAGSLSWDLSCIVGLDRNHSSMWLLVRCLWVIAPGAPWLSPSWVQHRRWQASAPGQAQLLSSRWWWFLGSQGKASLSFRFREDLFAFW